MNNQSQLAEGLEAYTDYVAMDERFYRKPAKPPARRHREASDTILKTFHATNVALAVLGGLVASLAVVFESGCSEWDGTSSSGRSALQGACIIAIVLALGVLTIAVYGLVTHMGYRLPPGRRMKRVAK